MWMISICLPNKFEKQKYFVVFFSSVFSVLLIDYNTSHLNVYAH